MDELQVTENTAGENEQEVAETAPETTAEVTGANEQEVADPAPAQQTPETNAQFAAVRRRAEAQAAQRLQAEKDALVRKMLNGQTNPYTGKPFTTEAEYNQYLQQYESDQLKTAGIDPDMLGRMIENNPTVQQARQVISQVQQEQGKRALESAISEISKLDPSVTGMETLMHHPNFQQFNDFVMRGYSLVDAFKLANFDQLSGRRAAAARQQAINDVNGKNHLSATQTGTGGEDVVVPEETMSFYRAAFPHWTKQQIIDDYKKNK